MNESNNSIEGLHELLSILQFIDVGLVVLDRDYQVSLWNSFMENHSGLSCSDVAGKCFFDIFPDIQEDWLRKKIDSVFHLKNRTFSVWKHRPFLTKFQSDRPITGSSEWMYQNFTTFPLANPRGEVDKVCLMIYDVTNIALREQAFQTANKQLEELSQIDGLTNLFNRRTWEEKLSMEYKRSCRSDLVSSVVMFDIDHFKLVNDTYGHQAGDEIIRMVAKTLRQQQRETDISGRYGGEEFGVILPDTNSEGALVFCERLRKVIEKTVTRFDGQDIPITISLGIAETVHNDGGHAKWLQHSDEALYQSKEGGRNMSKIYNNPDS